VVILAGFYIKFPLDIITYRLLII